VKKDVRWVYENSADAAWASMDGAVS